MFPTWWVWRNEKRSFRELCNKDLSAPNGNIIKITFSVIVIVILAVHSVHRIWHNCRSMHRIVTGLDYHPMNKRKFQLLFGSWPPETFVKLVPVILPKMFSYVEQYTTDRNQLRRTISFVKYDMQIVNKQLPVISPAAVAYWMSHKLQRVNSHSMFHTINLWAGQFHPAVYACIS